MASQQDIERWIVKKIISEVHDGSTRLSDSGQRELHLVVRERMPSPVNSEEIVIDKKELDALIVKFAEQIHKNVPNQSDSGKRPVVRRTLIGRIIDLFSDIWPFGE